MHRIKPEKNLYNETMYKGSPARWFIHRSDA